MALTSRLRTMGRVSNVAASTAPYVRRVASDEELRGDVADFVRSANDLLRHISADRRLRHDVGRLIGSVQDGADHLRADIRPRNYGRRIMIGTGLLLISTGMGMALAWPRTRQRVVYVADQTAQRANATVHDIRERISGRTGERRAA
jgi:hypothetical protein